MNSETIFNYIKEIEIKILDLQKKNEILMKDNENLKNELNNFNKVSIITNLNKQISDKQVTIDILEKKINFFKIDTKNNLLENKINDNLLENKMNDILIDDKINDNLIEDNLLEDDYEAIRYKKKDYYLKIKTNEIYDIKNDKPNNHIGNLVNNKLKFI